jgi:hypothetical protein
MGGLAYELMHVVRTVGLSGSWQQAQVKSLRTWLIRMPAKLVRHARAVCVKLMRHEPMTDLLVKAVQRLEALRGPPLLLRG